MTQLDLAITQGKNKMEACLEKTRQTEQSWPERAYAALVAYVNVRKGFKPYLPFSGEQAVEFVLRQPGIEAPHDRRSFGALFQQAARKGLIRRSDTMFQRKHGHGTKSPGWEPI